MYEIMGAPRVAEHFSCLLYPQCVNIEVDGGGSVGGILSLFSPSDAASITPGLLLLFAPSFSGCCVFTASLWCASIRGLFSSGCSMQIHEWNRQVLFRHVYLLLLLT